MTERRVVNSKTGGEKGAKDIQMSLVPVTELREVARLYHEGAKKYARDNWRKGYDWSLSYDALNRHLMAFWEDRESHDEETGCHHLSSVVFHAFALMYFERVHPDLDDRPATLLERAAQATRKAARGAKTAVTPRKRQKAVSAPQGSRGGVSVTKVGRPKPRKGSK